MSEMITKSHALVAQFGDTLDRLLDGIENFVANSRPTLGGERFLTDREVSARLKVSRRTLQDYRNTGMIAYYQLGGKILYKESDIERMLAANYRENFRRSFATSKSAVEIFDKTPKAFPQAKNKCSTSILQPIPMRINPPIRSSFKSIRSPILCPK